MTKSGKESTRRSRRLQLQDIKIVEDNKEEKEDEEDEEDEEDDDLIIDPTKLVIAVFPDKRKRKTVSKRSTIQKSSTCSKRNIQRGKSTQKEQIYPILPKGIKEVDPYHSEDEIVLSDHNHNDVTTTTVGLGFPTSLRTLKKDTIRFKKLFPGLAPEIVEQALIDSIPTDADVPSTHANLPMAIAALEEYQAETLAQRRGTLRNV